MIVAIQGEPGSFSEAAARSHLGEAIDLLCCATFDELFEAVAMQQAALGVVPVANSIVGPVEDNRERVERGGFGVMASLWLPVQQCLISRPGTRLSDVQRVASHPVALRQCARIFDDHPGWTPVEAHDTAGSVRALMHGTLTVDAVIASALAAGRYHAQVLLANVQDEPANATQFLIITPP